MRSRQSRRQRIAEHWAEPVVERPMLVRSKASRTRRLLYAGSVSVWADAADAPKRTPRTTARLREIRRQMEENSFAEQQRRRAEDRIREELQDSRATTIPQNLCSTRVSVVGACGSLLIAATSSLVCLSLSSQHSTDFAQEFFRQARFWQEHVATGLLGATAIFGRRARGQDDDGRALGAVIVAESGDQFDTIDATIQQNAGYDDIREWGQLQRVIGARPLEHGEPVMQQELGIHLTSVVVRLDE